MKLWSWLKGLRPVTRRRMDEALREAERDVRSAREAERGAWKRVTSERDQLERERARIDEIIARFATVEYREREDRFAKWGLYAVTVKFSPWLIELGKADPHELEIVARRVGNLVYEEIRRAKFVEPDARVPRPLGGYALHVSPTPDPPTAEPLR